MNEKELDLAKERYVSLVTFRRNGIEVATPVWIASANDRYYVFSEGGAGKVKRLRNDKRVRVAACDMRGKVSGGSVGGAALVLTDGPTIELAYRALRTKYGWQMKVGDVLSKLSGRYGRRVILEIQLDR